MTCPRCGAQIDGFPCPQCGFPVTLMQIVLRNRSLIRKIRARIQLKHHKEKIGGSDA